MPRPAPEDEPAEALLEEPEDPGDPDEVPELVDAVDEPGFPEEAPVLRIDCAPTSMGDEESRANFKGNTRVSTVNAELVAV